MKLSQNFALHEFTKSQTASRRGIDNTPPPEHIENLRMLCERVLQPLRETIKVPIIVTSGYRSPELNEAIGGSATSHHCKGMAADIEALHLDNRRLAMLIESLHLPYTQLILECYESGKPNSGWVHVSYDPDDVRSDVLTYANGKYTAGIMEA